jgi:hypothetical protein
MLRLLAAVVAALALVPTAAAWTWPVDGPVLRRFALGDDPYAGGQHRGVDVGGAVGVSVRAPAAGSVSFAGPLPGGGLGVTIGTADGYSVTLLQLGAVSVKRGEAVAEGTPIGTVGPSADPITLEPHVHLGIRRADEPEGYLDPLSLLPPRVEQTPAPAASEPAPAAAEPSVGQPATPSVAAPEATPPVAENAAPVRGGAPVAAPASLPLASAAPDRGRPRGATSATEAATARTSGRTSTVTRQTVRTAVRTAALRAVGQRPPRRIEGSSKRPAGRLMRAPRTRATSGPYVTEQTGRSVGRALPGTVTEPTPAGTTSRPADASRRSRPAVPIAAAVVLAALAALAAAAFHVAVTGRGRARAARIMDADAAAETRQDPGCGGVAVCERPEAHRPRGGVRRPVRHLRALPPPQGQRRPHGQRDGRARDARDGRGGQGRALAA